MNSRMNWVTTEVSFVCIVQTLWQCQLIFQETVPYLSFRFFLNGGRQVTEKPFTSMKKEM